jgi:hypothetical protein
MGGSNITDRAAWMSKESSSGERQPLDELINDGCLECTAVVDFLSQVFALSKQVPVPEELVQAAIRVFPAAPPPMKPSSAPELPVLAARLTYSSLQSPEPEGGPECAPGDVHLKYETGNHVVDMRLEREVDSPEVILVGHIASRSTSKAPPSRVPVRVGTGARTLSRGVTDTNGEFSLVYTPREDLRLSIPIAAEGVTVEISLDDIPGCVR